MKKYLLEAGYSFSKNYNDMTNKEFYLAGITYQNSDTTTMGGFKLDREETYGLFLKDIDGNGFKAKIESIVHSAISDGVANTIGTAIVVENVENGYNVTMSFIIQG